jgi:hypothetical protein
MSSLIPIKIAELAIDNLNREIQELKEKVKAVSKAGRKLSLEIHRSKQYSDFYPTLGDFERYLDSIEATNGCCYNRPAMGEARGLCEGPCRTGEQEDGRSSNV